MVTPEQIDTIEDCLNEMGYMSVFDHKYNFKYIYWHPKMIAFGSDEKLFNTTYEPLHTFTDYFEPLINNLKN